MRGLTLNRVKPEPEWAAPTYRPEGCVHAERRAAPDVGDGSNDERRVLTLAHAHAAGIMAPKDGVHQQQRQPDAFPIAGVVRPSFHSL